MIGPFLYALVDEDERQVADRRQWCSRFSAIMNGASMGGAAFGEAGLAFGELDRSRPMTSARWLRAIRSTDPSLSRAVHARPRWMRRLTKPARTTVERCSCRNWSSPSFAM